MRRLAAEPGVRCPALPTRRKHRPLGHRDRMCPSERLKRTRMTIAGTAVAGVAALALTGLGAGAGWAQENPAPVASISNLRGESTSVKLDFGFTDALTSLQITPAPTGKATVTYETAKFPITGGNVTVYKPGSVDPYVQGMIRHEGSGLSLTKGDIKLALENFVVDPGKPATLTGKVLVNGKTVAESVKLFDLDGSTLKPITTDTAAGTATLTGTTVRLSDEAAQALAKAFSTESIKGGTTVGIATIVVNLPGTNGDMATPAGGVDTGDGSTSGIEDFDLIAVGALALVAAGGVALVARRRLGAHQR